MILDAAGRVLVRQIGFLRALGCREELASEPADCVASDRVEIDEPEKDESRKLKL